MTALAAVRNVLMQETAPGEDEFPMVDNTKIYKGGLVAVVPASGLARPAANTATHKVVGIALESRDNTVTGHAAGSPTTDHSLNWIKVRWGIIVPMACVSAAQTWVGSKVYVVDDQTVDIADPSNGVIAGECVGYESATLVDVLIQPPGLTAA